jgi:predicted amino acid dehydrogenase
MSEVRIPAASLDRLRTAYAQFEQLSVVVAEAMGLPSGVVTSVNLQHGVFIIDGGLVDEVIRAEPPNGVSDYLLDGTQAR